MQARNRAVEADLRAAGIDAQIRIFSAHTPSARAAADALGVELGAIANSLVFMAVPNADACGPAGGAQPIPTDEAGPTDPAGSAGEPFAVLLMTSGAHRVDTGYAAARLGVARLKRATPEQVRAATGQVIGGVSPCGHPAPLPIYVDRALRDHDVLWAAGGTADAMFPLSYAQLLALTCGEEIDVEP